MRENALYSSPTVICTFELPRVGKRKLLRPYIKGKDDYLNIFPSHSNAALARTFNAKKKESLL
jgi:hypothetical protein